MLWNSNNIICILTYHYISYILIVRPTGRSFAKVLQMENDYSQEIANSPTTKNFFLSIEEVLKEYQAEGLTREEAIKRFCKENNKGDIHE